MTPSQNLHAVFAATLALVLILSLHVLPLEPILAYCIVSISASAVFLFAAWFIMSRPLPERAVTVLLVAAVAVRLSFLFTEPIGSDDIYRYIWDGKAQSAGFNPYQYAPDAPELEHLHSDRLPGLVNHPHIPTIYFPITQWVFLASYELSNEDVWGFKLMVWVAELATILALLVLLRGFGIPRRMVLLYAVCPLPILQFGLDGHMDALGVPFLVLSVMFYLSGKRIPGLLLLGVSIAVKPAAAVLLPVLFLTEKGWLRRMLTLILPLAVVLVEFLPYMTASTPLGTLQTYTEHWVFNGPVFETLNLFFRNNLHARIACGVLLVVALPLIALARVTLAEKLAYAILVLLLLSPVVYPWYVVWLAVFLPLVPRWSAIVFVATVSLAAITALTYDRTGVWEQYPAVLALEYVPVFVCLGFEVRRTLAAGKQAPAPSDNV